MQVILYKFNSFFHVDKDIIITLSKSDHNFLLPFSVKIIPEKSFEYFTVFC